MLEVVRELWAESPALAVGGLVLCPALLALVAHSLVAKYRAMQAAARAQDATSCDDGW